MNKIQTLIFFFLFSLLSCSEDPITPTMLVGITGQVFEQESGTPVEGARVTVLNNSDFTRTDSLGQFKFDSLSFLETYSLEVEAQGFLDESILVSFTINGPSTRDVEIPLEIDVAFNQLPSVPELLFPETSASDIVITPVLRWKSNEDVDDDLEYEVILYDENQSESRSFITKDTSLQIGGLNYDRRYFWQVIANDQVNQSVASRLRSFRTQSFPSYRIHFVRQNEITGNLVVFAGEEPVLRTNTNVDSLETLPLTDSTLNCWRPHLNVPANRVSYLSFIGTEAHIFTMERDGGDVRQVTSSRPINTFNLLEANYSWSPNGGRFIYPSKDELLVINENGTGLELFATADVGYFFTEVDWSNRGFIAARMQTANRYNSKIVVYREDGSVVDTILDTSNNPRWIGGPVLSESSDFVLYTEDRANEIFPDELPRRARILISDYNGNVDIVNRQEVPPNTSDLMPALPPGGEIVMFVNRPSNNVRIGDIFIMENSTANTNDTRTLAFPNATMPDWQ